MNINYFLTISPAFLAVVGLVMYIGGQFLKNRFKIFCSIVGILFIGLFIYKLFMLENESQLTYSYADRNIASFHLSFESGFFIAVFLAIGINVLAFIFWLSTILKATFDKIIPKQSQMTILFSGAFIIILSIILFVLLGYLVGAICFPIMAIAYFISFNSFYRKIKTEAAPVAPSQL